MPENGEDHPMTLETEQPTSSGMLITQPTPRAWPTNKGKEPETHVTPSHDSIESEDAILTR
jgi:hypothetical protein